MAPSRILIVEDDPIFRSTVADNLLMEGYEAEAVGDGKTALIHVRKAVPDLIILDLNLPDWDGLNLCPLLRGGRSVPIIVLSARGQKIDKLSALRLGADDYIVKPVDLEELIARIRAVLRRSHQTFHRLIVGRVVVDFEAQQATSGRNAVPLTHH